MIKLEKVHVDLRKKICSHILGSVVVLILLASASHAARKPPVSAAPPPEEYLLFFQEGNNMKMAHFDKSGLLAQPVTYDQNSSVMNTFHSFIHGNTVKTITYKMSPVYPHPRFMEYCQFTRTNVQARQCFNLTQSSNGLLELTLSAKQDDQGNVYVLSLVKPTSFPFTTVYLDMVKIDPTGQQVFAGNVAQSSNMSRADWIDFSLVPGSNPPLGVVARQGADPSGATLYPPVLELFTINLANGTQVQYEDLTPIYSPPSILGVYIWEIKVLAGNVLPSTGQAEIFLFFTGGVWNTKLAYKNHLGAWQPAQAIGLSSLDAVLYPSPQPQQQTLVLTYNKIGTTGYELWNDISIDSMLSRVANFRLLTNTPIGDTEILIGRSMVPIVTSESVITLRLFENGQITRTIPLSSSYGVIGNSPIVALP